MPYVMPEVLWNRKRGKAYGRFFSSPTIARGRPRRPFRPAPRRGDARLNLLGVCAQENGSLELDSGGKEEADDEEESDGGG